MFGYLFADFHPFQRKVKTATWLANRTITEFLRNLNSVPSGNPHREAVVSSVIRLTESQPDGCLQADAEGRCIWRMTQTVTERVSGKSVTKRDVSLDSKESTRHFVTNFLQKLAKKSYPLIKNQIMSVFSNESKTFLPLPADTVKKG